MSESTVKKDTPAKRPWPLDEQGRSWLDLTDEEQASDAPPASGGTDV